MSLIQKLFAYVNVSVSSANRSGVNQDQKASFGPSLGYPFPGFCQVCWIQCYRGKNKNMHFELNTPAGVLKREAWLLFNIDVTLFFPVFVCRLFTEQAELCKRANTETTIFPVRKTSDSFKNCKLR